MWDAPDLVVDLAFIRRWVRCSLWTEEALHRAARWPEKSEDSSPTGPGRQAPGFLVLSEGGLQGLEKNMLSSRTVKSITWLWKRCPHLKGARKSENYLTSTENVLKQGRVGEPPFPSFITPDSSPWNFLSITPPGCGRWRQFSYQGCFPSS